jgi:hypothetical protein
MDYYTCPVCGYDHLEDPPRDWEICPCCRTQFEYSDRNRSYAELRAAWIATGAPWGSQYTSPPPLWSPIKQLRNIGYEATTDDVAVIMAHHNIALG